MPHVEAIDRMTTRYESATVVGLTARSATKTSVTTPTAATATADRTVERSAVDIPPNLSGNAETVQPLRGDLRHTSATVHTARAASAIASRRATRPGPGPRARSGTCSG